MALQELIKSLTDDFILDQNEHFLYFSVPESTMYNIPVYLKDKTRVLNCATDKNPMKPFISAALECNISKNDIYDNFYSLQAPVFYSFYETGIANVRYDVINIDEIYYERKRFSESLQILFEKVSDKLFLVLNAQDMPDESIQFLTDLSKTNFNGKIIFCFNNERIEQCDPKFQNFYQKLATMQNFLEITESPENEESFYSDYTPEFNYETYFNILHNCRIFLSLDQGLKTFAYIEDKLHNYPISELQKRELYLEIGLINFYAKNFDQAYYYLNFITENQINDELTIPGLFAMIRVLQAKNLFSTALKYVITLKDELEKNPDSPFYPLAFMSEYFITQKTSPEIALEKYYNTLSLLDKYGYKNNYILTALNIPWKIMNNNSLRNSMLPFIDNIISIAEGIGNEYSLATAYNWKGIILLHDGNVEQAHKMNSKCNELRTQINDLPAIIKIRNSLSYEYLMTTRYKKSYDLLNEMSDKLTDLKETSEIIITLNNFANTLFYSCHFDEAYNFYQEIILLMNSFNLSKNTVTSFLPEFNDILIHKAYIEMHKGFLNRAKISLYNILHNNGIYTKINIPIINLMEAIFALKDGKTKLSNNKIIEAEESFSGFSSAQSFRHVFVLYEYAAELFKINRTAQTHQINEILQKAFEIAKEHNLGHFIENDGPLPLEKHINNIEHFEKPKINLKELNDNLQKDMLMNQLHKELKISQFLNKIMSHGSKNENDVSYSKNIIHSIVDYTAANSVFIYILEDDKWSKLAFFSKTENHSLSDEELNDIIADSAKFKTNENLTFLGKYNYFYSNISKYHYKAVLVIVPSRDICFTQEDISTLEIAIANIQAQIIMRLQNKHLLFISSTDQLSMLNNRRALQDKLLIESEMVRRYLQKKNKYFQLSISFIDLDNFKFINDTFGHDVGDIVILKFSDLMQKIYRRVDFICRFGGDEFVILLPNTNCKEAYRAGERLREGLIKAEYFIPEIEKAVHKKISIKNSQRLGFSMGICSNFEMNDPTDMNTTLTNADRALYYSKEHGKNRTTIWSDIKDEYMKIQKQESEGTLEISD
ncbi:MAG: GGDEF domain-containing protein [Treponema sp.]|nr:GGDEF domain-containing protein [Treponema sp.]